MSEPLPDMDAILKSGRSRQKRLELGIGVLLVAGGAAFRFGAPQITGGASLGIYGAIGIGAALILDGVFGSGRGERIERLR